MRFKTYKYKILKSTNDQAINFIKNSKISYGFIMSDTQTAGRGTAKKKWISLKGNLFGSIFFPLKKNFPAFNEFTFISPTIIYKAIKSFCKSCEISFKWPNDILINNKKICGILQEVIRTNNRDYLIIGMGINLVTNPKIKGLKTTNILDETKIKIDRNEIVKKIIEMFENFFSEIETYSFQYYKNKANLLSIKPNNLI